MISNFIFHSCFISSKYKWWDIALNLLASFSNFLIKLVFSFALGFHKLNIDGIFHDGPEQIMYISCIKIMVLVCYRTIKVQSGLARYT